jgi:hypothetical protein
MPRGLRVLIIYFTAEIIIFFRIMEPNTYFYGPYSREKKEFNGEKVTIIFSFLPQIINPKNFSLFNERKGNEGEHFMKD